jgi:NAD+ kinase
MKIAIYGKKFNEDFNPYFEEIIKILETSKVSISINKLFYETIPVKIRPNNKNLHFFSKASELKKDTDILLSIGGDGTFLDCLTYVLDTGIPIAGINSGRLGFLANISKTEIKQAISQIVSGNFKYEERDLIHLITPENLFKDCNYALNELTINKKDSSSMISIKVYSNGQFLNTYWADGLIIATPTGSTAYSLSVGGPIVVPEAQNFIITPIAPHNLTVRPIVVSNNHELTLTVSGRDENYLVALDRRYEVLSTEIELKIRKASFKIKLIKHDEISFFGTLQKKLMWGLDNRN